MNINALVVRTYNEEILLSIEFDDYFCYVLEKAFESINKFESYLIYNSIINIPISDNIDTFKLDYRFEKEFNEGNIEIKENGLESLLLNETELFETKKEHWKIINYPYQNYLNPDYDMYFKNLKKNNFDFPNKKIIFENNEFHIEIFENNGTDKIVSVAISYLDFKNAISNLIDTDYKPEKKKK